MNDRHKRVKNDNIESIEVKSKLRGNEWTRSIDVSNNFSRELKIEIESVHLYPSSLFATDRILNGVNVRKIEYAETKKISVITRTKLL